MSNTAEFTDDEDMDNEEENEEEDFVPEGESDDDDDFEPDDDEDFEPAPAAKGKAGKAATSGKASKSRKSAKSGKSSSSSSSAKSSQSSTATPKKAPAKRKSASQKETPQAKKSKKKDAGKPKKVVKGKAPEVIFNYMRKVNRPYNATGIFENLHRAVPRKMVDTALAALVKEEKIQMKAYGKTKIFWLNQDIFETLTPEEMEALEEKHKTLKEEVEKFSRQNNKLQRKVEASEKSMTDEELDAAVQAVTGEVQGLKTQLEAYSSMPPPDPELLQKQETEIKKYLKLWKLRKRALMDFVGQLADSQMKKDKKVLEDMDCETDESAGATPKDFARK